MHKLTKRRFLMICLIFSMHTAIAQTFTNSTPQIPGWNDSLKRTLDLTAQSLPALSTGTFKLKQVIIHMGNMSDGTVNFSYYAAKLTAPNGAYIYIITGRPNGGSWTFSSSTRHEFDIKFRDNSNLMWPSTTAGSQNAEPWNIGYYKAITNDVFNNFSGINPNGVWTLTIYETSVSNGCRFNDFSLEFGVPYVENNLTSYTVNDNCSSPLCLLSSEITIGTNVGFSDPGSISDLWDPNTTPSCIWNSNRNNSAWFKFIATATTSHITISGVTGSLQTLVVQNTLGICNAANYSVVNGGCPEDAINDTYPSQRYSNGSTSNQQLNLSGLNIGQTYYLVVDGEGGAVSPFYIEISGASNTCTDVLPVEFVNFTSTCQNDGQLISWQTYTETNNDYFTILKSEDGEFFSAITEISGAGNSNVINNYNYLDNEINDNTFYYQIKQTDFDGKFTYSELVNSNCSLSINGNITAYYNKSNSTLAITLNRLENSILKFTVYDMLGRTIITKNQNTNGITKFSLPIDITLDGCYILTINNNDKNEAPVILKFIK